MSFNQTQLYHVITDLFDSGPGVMIWLLVEITFWFFPALARVGFTANSVHGHSQSRVRLNTDAAKTHRSYNVKKQQLVSSKRQVISGNNRHDLPIVQTMYPYP